MNSIQLLIKEICEEEGISFHTVSDGWILVLEKEGQIHYICGSRFDLNNYVSAKICNDKYACYSTLKYHHIPVCEHHILYADTPHEKIESLFHQYQENVVVKTNGGSYGDNVYHVEDIDSLWEKIDLLLQRHYSISLSPFYNIICEYRIIVLNGKVELIYGKKRPIVVGDGVHTIYELLCKFNPPFFEKLEDHSSLDRVLDLGEEYIYSWQHNLSKGAIPFEVKDSKLIEDLTKVAIDATEKLQLNFVSVDIVDIENQGFKILEINSGVITNIADYFKDGDQLAKELYKKAILAMFKK